MSYTIYTTFHKDEFINEYNLHEDEHHKLFPAHKSVNGNNINLMNPVYSEMVCMWYVWKNNLKSDYVGFEHYRRKLDVKNPPEKGYCYVFEEVTFGETIYQQYSRWHNHKDLDFVIDILEEFYGKDNEYSKTIRESKILLPFCTYMMSWEDFTEMCSYLFDIIDKYSEKVGITGYTEVSLDKWKQKAFREFNGINWKYQTRFIAFLSERLISTWIQTHLKHECVGIDRGKWLAPDLNGNNMSI